MKVLLDHCWMLYHDNPGQIYDKEITLKTLLMISDVYIIHIYWIRYIMYVYCYLTFLSVICTPIDFFQQYQKFKQTNEKQLYL